MHGHRALLRGVVQRLLLMHAPELDRRAGRVWSVRQRAERAAAARFRRLADELSHSGAHDVVVSLAQQAAHDEVRHAYFCAELAAHFGVGGKRVGGSENEPAAVGPSGLGTRARTAYEVVAMCCVSETISVAALGRIVERARDPLVRARAHAILRDEIDHARLGWAHLAAESRSGVGSLVADYLPAMLDETCGDELVAPAARPDPIASLALAERGALEHGERRALVANTLRSVIFVGFERFGIDTRAGMRWLERLD